MESRPLVAPLSLYKKYLRFAFYTTIPLLLSGCLFTYAIKSGYNQSKILWNATEIKKVLIDDKIDKRTKKKLRLILKAKTFAENELHLKKTRNYQKYSDIKRPYVTHLLRVSERYQLKTYIWDFPFVGELPYKGFFNKEDALVEKKEFDEKGYDTYIRGVSAYSTIGWFNDPVLSTMLSYDDHALVNLIIHETVHATIFIEGHADFNEQLATFIGDKGMELFYKKYEGNNSKTLQLVADENFDSQLFSKFISKEIKNLKEWYTTNEGQITPDQKKSRLIEIQLSFDLEVKPYLKTKSYIHFSKMAINNAALLPFETYLQDMDKFEKKYKELGSNFKNFLSYCKKLKKPF